MSIALLDESYYLGAQCPNPDEVGVSEATHIAAVKFSAEDKPTRAYIKFCGPDEVDFHELGELTLDQIGLIHEKRLFNEILAYTLAHHLHIKQPPRAAVIILPLTKFRENNWPIPHWIPDNVDRIPAWCTEESPSRSISYIYKTENLIRQHYLQIFQSCKNWYGTVSAFDEWLANTDRNGGNILKLSSNVYSIIDHGRIFNNLDFSALINTNISSRNIMRNLVELGSNHGEHNKLYSAMVMASDSHKPALDKSITEIKKWLNLFNSIDEATVLRFIEDRSSDSWMSNRLGVL